MMDLNKIEKYYKKIFEIVNFKINDLDSYELQKHIKDYIQNRLKTFTLNNEIYASDIDVRFGVRSEPQYSDIDLYNDELITIRFREILKKSGEELNVENEIKILFLRKKENSICIEFKKAIYQNSSIIEKTIISFNMEKEMNTKEIYYLKHISNGLYLKTILNKNQCSLVTIDQPSIYSDKKINKVNFSSLEDYINSDYKDVFFLTNDIEIHSPKEIKMLKVLDRKINNTSKIRNNIIK